MRWPTNNNIKKLYAFHEEKHGFSRMLRSINCTDWLWAQCPYAYHAQLCMSDCGQIYSFYWKRLLHKTYGFGMLYLVLSVEQRYQRYTSIAYFQRSQRQESTRSSINMTYKWGYFLVARIYLEWSVLIKFIHSQTQMIQSE